MHCFTITTFFEFIFSLSNILADHQKKKKQTNKQTSNKYTRFQKTVLLFQISQKITFSKGKEKDHDRPTPVKAKTTRKGKREARRKRKGMRRRKRKEIRRKEGRKGIMEEAGLKNIPSKHTAPSEYVPRSGSINGQD